MNTPTFIEKPHSTDVQRIKAERTRVSELCRKLAYKLGTMDAETKKRSIVYFNYTMLQDYRSELTSQLQLAIRMERHGF